MSISSLKNNRAKQFEALTQKLQAGDKQYANQDDRYWKPTTDKAGVGSAVIRFLPPTEGEDESMVKIFDHGFQGPTGLYYIEKSRTTIGEADPLAEMNRELWATEIKENQELVRQRKRRLKYVSNIYVVKDPGNPANEGKVFLFSYGVKIFDMLKALIEEDAIDPFDPWTGANFRLKVKRVEKFPNYDASKFESPSPMFGTADEPDDDKIEAVWRQQYKLKELIAPDQFKSYEQLQQRLHQVLGLDRTSAASQVSRIEREETQMNAPVTQVRQEVTSSASSDDEDDMSWFDRFKDED